MNKCKLSDGPTKQVFLAVIIHSAYTGHETLSNVMSEVLQLN